ncbi:aminotransferase class IV family protein [Sulfurimonas microaerophilic]|uniref:aminotransferase class IV family protein n=1 Tax=Sulfurimonas microaerophilic TaxID=3058392 RepID=UPI0027154A40|nr:aminotransferase class IV family protein [Sulfurimonas sp. hsl 1-7]
MNKQYLETIKILDRKVYNLDYHQARVDRTIGEGKLDLFSLIKPEESGLLRCRILYDQDNASIEYIPYEKREIKKLKLVFDDTIEYSKKYGDREHINKLFEQREECDDVLIVKDGLVTDTSIANIAFFDGDIWLTPKQPLLEGTMRAKLLDEKKIFATYISYKDISKFQKIALMNAMIDFDIITSDNLEDTIC